MQAPKSTQARTVVADLATLIKQGKISKAELSRIDPLLRRDAEAYAETLNFDTFDLQSFRQENSGGKISEPPPSPPQPQPEKTVHPTPVPPPVAQAPLQPPTQPPEIKTSPYATYTAAKFQSTHTPVAGSPHPAQKGKFESPVKMPIFTSSQPPVSEQSDPLSMKNQLEAELENEISSSPHISSASVQNPIQTQPSAQAASPAFIPTPVSVEPPKETIDITPIQVIEAQRLQRQVNDIATKIDSVSIEEKAAHEYVTNIQAKLAENAGYFSTADAQEMDLEKQEEEVRKSEQLATTLKERKTLEEQRWAIEEQLQKIEDDRWQKNQDKTALEKELVERKANEAALTERRKTLQKDLDKASTQLAALRAKDEIDIYQSKLDQVKLEKKNGEDDWQKQNQAKQKAEKDLEENMNRQAALQQAITQAEIDKRKATSEELRHIHEEQRRKAEAEFRDIEKASWQLEEAMEAMEASKAALEAKFAQYQTEEEGLDAKIKELQELIQKAHE